MRYAQTAIKAAATTAAVLCFATAASAQATATQSITATATVSARARITLTGAVAFADADPTVTPVIDAAPLDVQVQARTSAAGAVTLTVIAGGNFVSGGDSIAIANLSWTTASAGFVAGTVSSALAQSVGAWTGPGTRSGQQTYHLANSWVYVPGNYSVTLTYTLTAP